MKKVAVLAVALILFNFICANFVYADPDPPEDPTPQETQGSTTSGSMSMDEYKKIADEGKITIGSSDQKISLADSDVGTATSKFGTFITTIAAIGVKMMSKFTGDGGYYYYESDYSAEKTGLFTINSLVFGEYILFNTKPYQKSSDLATSPSYTPSGINAGIDAIKERGALVSAVFVKIALMLAVPLVLYALVRTIISNKAKDLAAWKKILARWALCVFLIMFYEYIFGVIDTAVDSLVDVFWNMRVGLENAGYTAFETTVIEDLSFQLENTGGVTSLAYAVMFVALVVMQGLFLIKYAVRALAIVLLFMIAPVVILIHSIRLMLGKDSDILGELFKNYISLAFMQPLHALFYLIFFFTLSELAIKVPVLGLILIYALYRASQIAKAMFGFEIGSSIFSKK